MKPDSYMPLYGNEFINATDGLPLVAKWAYFRAIWHYWHNNHCKGLKPDEDSLRDICHVDREDWPMVYDLIFTTDQFFVQDEAGLWQQKRAQEEWNKSIAKYEKKLKQTEPARNARKR